MTDSATTAASTRPDRARALALGLLAALLCVAILPVSPLRAADPPPDPSASIDPSPSEAPSPSAEPTPSPTPAPTPIYTTQTAYRPGAGVRQYTLYWCVPASTQMMLNIIWRNRAPDTSKATQTRLAKAVGVNNRYRYSVPGNDIRGWAKALNARLPADAGIMYRDRAFKSQSRAMWALVDAIRLTSYPVGITVWHGGHAWVVVGYRLSAPPEDPARKSIAGFYVIGPLKTSRYADPFPSLTSRRGVYMPLAKFKTQFSWYDEDKKRAPWHRSYVMVRPEPVITPRGY